MVETTSIRDFCKEIIKMRTSYENVIPALVLSGLALYIAIIVFALYTVNEESLIIEAITNIGIW